MPARPGRAALVAAAVLIPAAALAFSPEDGLRAELETLRSAMAPALLAARALGQPPVAATPAQARALVKAKLAGSGVPDSYVDAVFDDPRTKLFPDIPPKFGTPTTPPPPVPYDQYRKYFVTDANLNAGAQFVRDHKQTLDAVKARYGVDGVLLTALVCVETRYGTAVGKYPVFDALNTIIQLVPQRSAWAVREEAEFLKMTYALGADAHGVVGSYAGAFGFVQFEPSTYNRVAVDFDDDGKRRLDDWPDALASAAHYLKLSGYDANAPYTPQSAIGRSIFSYNHSDNYVRVILDLREEIRKKLP